jgi:hypothetical protein
MNDISWVRMSRNPVAPTAIDVTWKSQDPGPSWVAFGTSEAYTHITPVVDNGSDEHAATLVGLPAETDVNFRVYTELPNGTVASSWNRVYTSGSISPILAQGEVTVNKTDQTRDGVFLLSMLGDRGSVQIIDREGNLLWHLTLDSEHSAIGVAPTPEGGAYTFNSINEDHSVDDNRVTTVGLDGVVLQDVALPWTHHVFGQMPDGTTGSLSTEFRDVDEYGNVAGDRLLGLHPDGSTEVLFDSWEELELVPGDEWDSSYFPGALDWTHMNGASYHPERGSWLLSLNGQDDILVVNDDGSLRELISMDSSRFEPPSSAMVDPHGPDWSTDGDLLIFGGDETQSWCSTYDVSEPGVLKETWSHGRGEGIFGLALGEARQLTDGNILCNFGAGGVVRELTPQGEIVWEFVAPAGRSLGRTHWLQDPYSGLWLDGVRR